MISRTPDRSDASEFDPEYGSVVSGAVIIWLVGAIAFYAMVGLAWAIAVTTTSP